MDHSGDEASLRYQCKPCFRNEAKIFCTVCKKDKSKREFDLKKLHNNKSAITRCRECQTCDTCGLFFDDARQLQCNVARCTKCILHKCTDCLLEKPSSDFLKRQIEHMMEGQQQKLCCSACRDKIVYACDAPPCNGRGKRIKKPKSEFDALQVASWQKDRSRVTLICKTCSDLGFSSKKGGTDGFSCARCRGSFGPGRFNAKQLDNKKQRPTTTLFCLGCRGI